MSSGSKQMVLGVAILIASAVFTVYAARTPTLRPATVHIAVPTVADHVTLGTDPRVLRVCADPNNMPFSNARQEGFENRIASLVAREMGRSVRYYWQPQRRGFIRATLAAGECDVVIGVPASFELARVTRPYYRSSFYFVSRRDSGVRVRSFDDRRLHRLRIGLEITGADYNNPPAAQALANRRIIDNVRGYPVYGDYSSQHPAWGLMDALRRRDVDVAIAWGPLAGYVARQQRHTFELTQVSPRADGPSLPFVFDISMGVRREDAALAQALDQAIVRRRNEIKAILETYGVPLVGPQKGVQG
jgi:mxaJ protein